MKKMAIVLMVFVMSMGTGVTTYASEEQKTVNEDVVIIREDVAREEAMQDATFSVGKANKLKKLEKAPNDFMSIFSADEPVSWKVWGERKYKQIDGKEGYIPYGYSAHMKGETVLDTYHYTRTYFGAIMKYGDSDRWWGTGTVCAPGTWVDKETASNKTLYVKYGTED